ncbi:MAG: RNA polymerase sigma-54 factor [Rickettsiales bacterium]|nr:RNA polymerase sigma-54 factor [Rickettsiales bacterium]
MQLNQRINIKHSQSIVMTPQLRQAIKLLQFSNLELSNYIEEEIEKNPFLENNKGDSLINNKIEKNDFNNNNEDDSNDGNRWEESYNAKNNFSYEDLSSFEDRIAAPKKSLREHLIEQILLDIPKGEERKIAMLFLDVIEPSGWININLDEFCSIHNLDKEFTSKVLLRLQTLDPCGVFARNLGECIRIQLKEKGLLDEKYKLITNNLELLAKGEIKQLCKKANIDEKKLSEVIKNIKALNPKPAESFANDSFRVEPPDVMISKTTKGWRVELNKSTLPSLKLEENFANEVKNNNKKEEDKKFVSESVNSAKWLLRAIEQRNSTTLKVAVEILKLQKDFFKNGPGHLKPLVLRDVAKSIGMHESTVSRVTRSKLLQTPWGLFQMKDFFSSSVGLAEKDEVHAAKTVRTVLKSIIESEKDNKPYSDEKISLIFKEKGVNVARRTVAKYREMLNIPSSAERKRLMRLNKVINI